MKTELIKRKSENLIKIINNLPSSGASVHEKNNILLRLRSAILEKERLIRISEQAFEDAENFIKNHFKAA